MDLQKYWQTKLANYSSQLDLSKPNIFATQAINYFPKSGILLDLGAGSGQDSFYFAKQGYRVLATDIVLEEIEKNTPPKLKDFITTQYLDLSQPITLTPESFDVVYCHLSLHFFDNARTQAIFDEVFGVLKPNGIFAVLANTLDDPEVLQSQSLGQDLYLTPSGIQKHFFSVTSMKKFITKFETVLLDNHGETHKDEIKSLIRFVGRKPAN